MDAGSVQSDGWSVRADAPPTRPDGKLPRPDGSLVLADGLDFRLTFPLVRSTMPVSSPREESRPKGGARPRNPAWQDPTFVTAGLENVSALKPKRPGSE